jgi:hypothetical protein
LSHGTSSGEDSSEPERKVDEAASLLRETVEHLSRRCPSYLLGAAAYEGLTDLRPHLEEALAALEDIEGRRRLTDEELARRRAFKMLLAATYLPRGLR